MALIPRNMIDLQMVEMSLRVLFRPDPHQLPFIYRRLGYGKPPRLPPSPSYVPSPL
jgi:hypothetical protein